MRSAALDDAAYSISGRRMSSAKMSGRCWPPIRMASSNPAVMTSSVGSPRRSSSAFVATVVPILTAETWCSLPGAAASSRSIPATAASS
jgi:hypothetical protein